ncbi:metallopeptidase [Parapedobacter defluvii]|uniref:Metallopeptidase n=1 Tax=Parapedobacter defluvii TaxID=2045106 RepID=A0ABQ1L5N4_9SPHI|nr:SprT-like domain-containing protein [Parapedobacter defluvii]RQP17225.1 MAG: sprT domain-containing protein [Parapedobacter sp.]GGC19895.1 metallopeptidase [Parapedobacter defluvii]
MPDYSHQLSQYMPALAAPVISRWIVDSRCLFRISKSRSSKLGDYRAPHGKHGHRISVNHNLNPYAFLITTIHEFAHLKTWNNHKNSVKPHGQEWKTHFGQLMQPFIQLRVFPGDVEAALIRYLANPAASSCTDLGLFRVLKRYDIQSNGIQVVEQLPENAIFSLKNGRVFQKKEKIRKRYRCIELTTRRIYLFSPVAEVTVLESPINSVILARHSS